MNKKLKIALVIGILVLCVIFIFVKTNNKKSSLKSKSNIQEKIISERIKQISSQIEKEIKTALDEVEADYKSAKEGYSGYTRGDFYNEQRMSEHMENAKLEFVNLNEVDLEKVYDLQENKIEDLSLEDTEKLKSLDNNLVNLATNGYDMEVGKNYLLRAESYR